MRPSPPPASSQDPEASAIAAPRATGLDHHGGSVLQSGRAEDERGPARDHGEGGEGREQRRQAPTSPTCSV